MLFAREITGPLSSLLKQLDAAVEKNKDADLRSFAVFLSDDVEATEEQLKVLAEKEKLSERVPLTVVEGIAGPPAHKIHQDAAVTVVLYTKGEVVSNFAFKAGELKDKDVKAIVAELPKILPSAEDAKQLEEIKKKLEAARKEREKKDQEKKEQK
jgi:hypothetical protein